MKKMKRALLAVALGTLILPVLVWAADNPLKQAKVGDWISFVTRTDTMGQKIEMTMKQTVVAKDATTITLRTVTTMMGNEMPGKDVVIQLDQPYQPYAAGIKDAKVTPLGEGDEAVTVAGKSYKCHWTKVRVEATQPTNLDNTVKIWTCKDVPVSGLVKMETDSTVKVGDKTMQTKMNMELTGAGNGK